MLTIELNVYGFIILFIGAVKEALVKLGSFIEIFKDDGYKEKDLSQNCINWVVLNHV